MVESAVCTSEYCNAGWSEVLTHMSPYGYANFGVAFGLGLSIVGAAWGIWLTGSSLVGAAVKAPRIRSKNLIRFVDCRAKRIVMDDLQWLNGSRLPQSTVHSTSVFFLDFCFHGCADSFVLFLSII